MHIPVNDAKSTLYRYGMYAVIMLTFVTDALLSGVLEFVCFALAGPQCWAASHGHCKLSLSCWRQHSQRQPLLLVYSCLAVKRAWCSQLFLACWHSVNRFDLSSSSRLPWSLRNHCSHQLQGIQVSMLGWFSVIIIATRHRASTNMYSLTFCVHFLLPECHQWKPAVQTSAVMLRTPPVDGQSTASRPRPLPIYGAQFWECFPSPASQQPAACADPAQPAIRTMSSYRRMDASL